MLVLSRKKGEQIIMDNGVVITLVRCGRGSARIGIEAPPEVNIVREEIAGKAEVKDECRHQPT